MKNRMTFEMSSVDGRRGQESKQRSSATPRLSGSGSTEWLQAAFLLANSETYESLKARGTHQGRTAEVLLEGVSRAAQFAEIFHPGRFADGAIENVALEIGTKLPHFVTPRGSTALTTSGKTHRRRVLHVASCVRAVGATRG